MIVERYRLEHLRQLIDQGVQPSQVSQVPATFASVALPPGLSMTVRDGDHIVLCGGIIPTGPKAGLLWAMLSMDAGRHMTFLHRATLRFLDLEPLRRIEATVEASFPAGCRWLTLLGFKSEGLMEAFGEDGEDHWRFARVRR